MKTIEVYQFSELSEKARKQVLNDFRDINTDFDWYEHIITGWYERLDELGFKKAEISFSGFFSQGDGCSFTASVDLEKFMNGKFEPLLKEDGNFRFEKYQGYSVYSQWSFKQDNFLSSEDMDCLCKEFVDHINELQIDLSRDIYSELMKEHDWLCSDEAVQNTIETNECYFLENGTMV